AEDGIRDRNVTGVQTCALPICYMQEIGRAGRDGKSSQAISLYQPDDSYLLETLLFADIITEEDVSAFELGMFLPPEKNEILDVLSSYYKVEQLRAIFKAAFERKQRGYYRMLGYKNLDQCRRAYMIEFFGENLTS